MKKLIWVIIVVVIVGGILLLNKKQTPQNNTGTIKLGVLFPLSGDAGAYGEEGRNGVELAVADFEKDHPQNKIQVFYEDDQGQNKNIRGVYQKLTSVDDVDIIVGALLQNELQVLAPMVNDDHLPMVSPASLPIEMRGKYTNPITLWPNPTKESEQMAEYVYNQGIRRVGILTTQDVWEQEIAAGFRNKFKSLGGVVTAEELTLQNSKDDKLPVTKVLASLPEAIYLGTYYKFFDFVKNARQLGFKGKFYSLEIDTNLAEQSKGLSDGTQFMSPNYFTTDFVQEYKEKYGRDPVIPAGQAYDSTMLALKLFVENVNREKIIEAMGNINEYDGVSGKITFSRDRQATFPINLFEIQNGEIIKIN